MAKKITQDQDGNDQVEIVNQPDGAPVVSEGAPVSTEVLSHQWQKDSPAINTNVLAGYASNKSVLDQIDFEPKEDDAQESEKPKVTKAEYDRRTKLDVSNPAFINPSLDHYEVTE